MGIGRIVTAILEDPLRPDFERAWKREIGAAQRQERQLSCEKCGLPGGTMVRVSEKAERPSRYRHAKGFCRRG